MSRISSINNIVNISFHIDLSVELISNKFKNIMEVNLHNQQQNNINTLKNGTNLLLLRCKSDKTTLNELLSKCCPELLLRRGIRTFFIPCIFISLCVKLRLSIYNILILF